MPDFVPGNASNSRHVHESPSSSLRARPNGVVTSSCVASPERPQREPVDVVVELGRARAGRRWSTCRRRRRCGAGRRPRPTPTPWRCRSGRPRRWSCGARRSGTDRGCSWRARGTTRPPSVERWMPGRVPTKIRSASVGSNASDQMSVAIGRADLGPLAAVVVGAEDPDPVDRRQHLARLVRADGQRPAVALAVDAALDVAELPAGVVADPQPRTDRTDRDPVAHGRHPPVGPSLDLRRRRSPTEPRPAAPIIPTGSPWPPSLWVRIPSWVRLTSPDDASRTETSPARFP